MSATVWVTSSIKDVFSKILCNFYTSFVQSGKICYEIKYEYREGSYTERIIYCLVLRKGEGLGSAKVIVISVAFPTINSYLHTT